MPKISVYPTVKEGKISGISPINQINLKMNISSYLNHFETTAILKKKIEKLDTTAPKIIKIQLQDSEDFNIPIERKKYELAETAIITKKD